MDVVSVGDDAVTCCRAVVEGEAFAASLERKSVSGPHHPAIRVITGL